MYGMVNKAIEGLICQEHGQDAWFRVVDRAGVEQDAFISLEPYPDQVTYALVQAASEELGAPADELLRAFGSYWTRYVGRRGYGALMSLEDRSLGAFLAELDQLHHRVAQHMPELRPPSFQLEVLAPGDYRLTYVSERAGLGPMVVGLLEGLLELKGLEGEVTWETRKDEGAPHDVFRVLAEGDR